jgi:hypothetical protein
MERLSVASARATGHDLTIFSYEPEKLRREGLDASIEDAREILSDPDLASLNARLPSYFVDWFRVEAMARPPDLGAWVDLDVVFLKTLPQDEYLFGWERHDLIGAAIARLPINSPVLDEYLRFCRRRPIAHLPPWWSLHKKMRFALKQFRRALRGQQQLKPYHGLDYPYGPPMLTHLLEKHSLTALAKDRNVFYPGNYEMERLATTSDVASFTTPDTVAVHLWRQLYRRKVGVTYPDPESWLAQKCNELGVTRTQTERHLEY